MKTEINIVAPEGYEIDREHSTLDCIKFKPVAPSKKIVKITTPLRGFEPNSGEEVHVNGKWAFSIHPQTEHEVDIKKGKAGIIYLADSNGYWTDERGNSIGGGVIYYQPNH